MSRSKEVVCWSGLHVVLEKCCALVHWSRVGRGMTKTEVAEDPVEQQTVRVLGAISKLGC